MTRRDASKEGARSVVRDWPFLRSLAAKNLEKDDEANDPNQEDEDEAVVVEPEALAAAVRLLRDRLTERIFILNHDWARWSDLRAPN
jgi:hypothetical protein